MVSIQPSATDSHPAPASGHFFSETTLMAMSFASGATPEKPVPLFRPVAIPATCVPCRHTPAIVEFSVRHGAPLPGAVDSTGVCPGPCGASTPGQVSHDSLTELTLTSCVV